MKESLFIKQNKQKWKDLEKHLASEQKDPDRLSDLYIQVSDDLSYARTFYPNRSVRLYLNNLAQQVYSNIYKSRRSKWSDVVFFWKEELPKIVWDSRKELTISFFVFVLSVSIGVFSAIQDPNFVRVILGDEYVNNTLQNIQNGDPMAVYKHSKNTDMFLGITVNNVKVDFITFASGLILGIGSVLLMFFNGIMVGVFQYFFVQQGLFIESALTIWLHGTLEMAGMVLAGAAGIRMGSGLVFPGSYSRLQAFQRSAMHGFKLLMGTVPITIFAAVIESFLTRFTETPDLVRLGLILLSLFFITGYFIVYPFVKSRTGFSVFIKQTKITATDFNVPSTTSIYSNTELIRNSFSLFHHFLLANNPVKIISLLVSTGLLIFALHAVLPEDIDYRQWFFFTHFFDLNVPVYIHVMHLFNLSLLLFFTTYNISCLVTGKPASFGRFALQHYYKACITALLIYPLLFLPNALLLVFGLAFLASPACMILITSVMEERNYFQSIAATFSYLQQQYVQVVGLFVLLSGCMALYYLFIESPFTYFFIEFVLFNIDADPETVRWIYISFYSMISYAGIFYLFPLCLYGTMWKFFSLKEIRHAGTLLAKIHSTWK